MASTSLLTIAAACSTRTKVNTIGVVVDKLDLYKTRGSSYGVTFTIKDCEYDTPTWQGGLKVKYFNDDPSVLPIVQLHDVVLLRGIRITNFQGKPVGVASQSDTVHWAIFRPQPGCSEKLPISRGPINFEPDPKETRKANLLLADILGEEPSVTLQETPTPAPQQSRTFSHQPPSTSQYAVAKPKSSALPFSLIQDAKIGRLTQLLGQVVKMNTYDSNKTLIYLTDYTVNTSLVDIKKDDDDFGVEGDSFGYLSRRKQNWPGPWGQLSIQVALWEPHASFAREYVKEGSIVHLTYVHVKDNQNGGMEAAVHRDKRFEDKIHVRLVSDQYDERAQQLLERRKAYWKIHGNPKAQSDPSTGPKKAKRQTDMQKRNNSTTHEARVEEGQTVLPKPTAQKKQNPNIKCREYGIPLRDVDSILSADTHINQISGDITYKLPFQNVCYRTSVRVVDFYPPVLEDFAVQVPRKPVASRKKDYDDFGPVYFEWEWRFCLLVEGPEPTHSKQQGRELMQIFVTGGEGTHLLQIDADDLHNNQIRTNELREKLFLLWGDLEERKLEAAGNSTGDDESWMPVKSSSLPFVCCIKEYGVKCGHYDPDAMIDSDSDDDGDQEICGRPGCFGWERRFAIFGTTIHS